MSKSARSVCSTNSAGSVAIPAWLWPIALALRDFGRDRTLTAVVAPAWLLMAVSTQTALLPSICMGSTQPGEIVSTAWDIALSSGLLLNETVAAAIMIAALMGPLVIAPARHVLSRQFEDNKTMPASAFLAGYASLWMLASAALLVPVLFLHLAGGGALRLSAAGAFLVAAGWQLTSMKAAFIRRCHRRTALSSWGFASVRDAGLFGIRHSLACIGTCWAMMLAVMLSSHHLAAAAVVTGLSLMERGSPVVWQRRNAWILSVMAMAECVAALSVG
jgi:predicted metal-binding membrane protein